MATKKLDSSDEAANMLMFRALVKVCLTDLKNSFNNVMNYSNYDDLLYLSCVSFT